MRRILGVLVALAALGAAAASVRGVDQRRDLRARTEAQRQAAELRKKLDADIGIALTKLESKATSAASLPQIEAPLKELRLDDRFAGSAVASTIEDGLKDERWWDAYRRTFPVTGLAVDGEKIDLLVGDMGREELAADVLVTRARTDGQASDIIKGKNWPYLAFAHRILLPNRGPNAAAIIVLAQPFDDVLLKNLSQGLSQAVVLSNGSKALGEAGAEAERTRLRALVGRESDGEPFADASGTWAAAAKALVPGFWLWVHTSTLDSARDLAHEATNTKVAVWAGGVLIALLSLIFSLRRPMPVPAATPVLGNATVQAPSTQPGLGSNPLAPVPSTGSGGAVLPPEIVSPHASTQAFVGPPPTAGGSSQVFGRYTLVERLGEGGMAQVFTAVTFGAEGFRRRFVVKRLRPELANEGAVVAQFIDEAKLGSTMVHSNIIPVFDFGKVGDEYFMATEYILGRDVGRVVRQRMERDQRPLPVELTLYIAHEALRALDYAHTRVDDSGRPLGIVHRDVSPANLLVSARGEVKLFDFGIVKAEGRVTRTEHGVVKGNVSFMSPEQARGGDVDARADLFSLGLVIVYALTGDVLYQGNTTYELLVKAASGPGPEERARIAALPAPVNTLLEKALATNPADRYPTAAAFAAAIAPHLRAGVAELAETMRALFGEDFAAEEARFAAAVPGYEVAARATPTASQTGSRKR